MMSTRPVRILCCTGFLQQFAEAFPRLASEIPNGHHVYIGKEAWPGVGHDRAGGGGSLNPFGKDFEAAGLVWTQELCRMDSDNDGLTNGQELGDPNCTWVSSANLSVTSEPAEGTMVRHPGVDEGRYVPSLDLGTARCEAAAEEVTKPVAFSLKDFYVPAELNGAYICKKFTLEGGDGLEFLKAEAFIGNDPHSAEIVHHMFLFGCTSEYAPEAVQENETGNETRLRDQDGPLFDCMDMPGDCVHLRAGWGVGGRDFCTPKDVSMPLSTHLVLQIHYNNPLALQGVVDSSGLILHVSERPMAKQAGILLIGPTPDSSMQIPAGKPDYQIQELCPASQLQGHLPAEGISIFGINLHMHSIGQKIHLEKKARDFHDFSVMFGTDAYVYDDQSVVPVSEGRNKVLPGEDLRVSCHYNSISRSQKTLGGTKLDEEMCFAIIAYYPFMPEYHHEGFPICFDLWKKIQTMVIIGETLLQRRACEDAGEMDWARTGDRAVAKAPQLCATRPRVRMGIAI
eukprot:TRINITY_DN36552_c0_g1_i1.p1 TRINITY_DN36552_c0_g1~~TRINITY_DN36552_c0_g1_i1.p1  ORF type:complete len:512 (-),score=50.68 TRINITY_DN36552_c0_g1_i1:247-1782(-)